MTHYPDFGNFLAGRAIDHAYWSSGDIRHVPITPLHERHQHGKEGPSFFGQPIFKPPPALWGSAALQEPPRYQFLEAGGNVHHSPTNSSARAIEQFIRAKVFRFMPGAYCKRVASRN